MAEFIPDIMTYGKIASRISDLRQALVENANEINSYQDISSEFEAIISEIVNSGHLPLIAYEEVIEGEPPDRRKMNEILNKLERDFALIETQALVTRSAAVLQFNQIKTEIKKNHYLNAQARDRLGVLQLYTNSTDENTLNFGSNLSNDSEFDKSQTSIAESPSLIAPGNLTLGARNLNLDLASKASVKILPGSNGFLGNNQEVFNLVTEIPAPAVGDSTEDQADGASDSSEFRFRQELFNPKFLEATLDGVPNTWVEFEVYHIGEATKNAAGNFNFKYTRPESPQLRSYNNSKIDSYSYLDNEEEIPWANGPFGGGNVLKLNLEYDVGEVHRANTINLSYHGLQNNSNEPFKVSRVEISKDGSEWTPLLERDVWIASDASKAVARVAPNVSIGTATWVFPDMDLRYARFYIEQPEPIPVVVGHTYYETKTFVEETYSQDENGEIVKSTKSVGGDRIEGPNPPVDNTDKYFGPIGGLLNNNTVRRLEKMDAKRWAIGVKDIQIRELEYSSKSSMVTRSFRVDGVIDRVSLEADYFIPEDFDVETQWIRFFVSPNEGLDWFEISRIQDDFRLLPEVIAFNDPIPKSYRDPNVQYVDVDTVVNSVKLKVDLTRPQDFKGKTPILRSYNIKVQKR